MCTGRPNGYNALADLTGIMRGFIEWQDGKMGSFEVNADSIMFSGKLTWNLYVIRIYMLDAYSIII